MLTYMIQCHNNYYAVRKLLSWLFHEDDLFIVSVDATSQFHAEDLGPFSALKNVIIAPRHPITWGGFSIVQATLSAIHTALHYPDWRYFINLSAVDLPLVTRAELLAQLAEDASAGVFNFVSDFGAVQIEPMIMAPGGDLRQVSITASSSATVEVSGSVTDFLSPGAKYISAFAPVTQPAKRPSFHVSESPAGKSLFCRPLYEYEVEIRNSFLINNEYHFGRQWVTLCRKSCAAIFESAIATEVYHFVRDTFIPDEAFFQTLFNTEFGKRPGHGWKKHNQRYHYGAPVTINDDNFVEILRSGSWFARKLDHQNAAQTIEMTDARMSSRLPAN